MLRIGKGKKEMVVTNKSYENYYKNSGWHIIGSKLQSSKTNNSNQQVSVDDDEWADVEDESDEEVRKPLSEMNRQELEQYAAELGVDLTGLTSNKQYREAIKAVL